MIAWRRRYGEDQEKCRLQRDMKLLKVMDTFIIFIEVIFLLCIHMSKFITCYTLNICSLLYATDISIKLLNCYVYKRVPIDINQSCYNISENDDKFLNLALEMKFLIEELLRSVALEVII